MKINIILPFYGKWELVHQRLNELYKFVHPSANLKVIIVNDKPDDNSANGAIKWWKDHMPLNIKYIHNDENLGFGGAMNRGAEEAKKGILIFLSNDVVISGDFIVEIIGALSEDNQQLIGDTLYDWDTGWNNLVMKDRKKILFPYLAGYLLACTNKVWSDLGGFDSIYYPYDYEDVDLSTTAIHKGYKLRALNSKYVRHISGATIRVVNPLREKVTLENQKKFISKWSEILGAKN